MKSYRLEDMVKGWFIGSFEPTAFPTKNCEVAVKKYKAGDHDQAHFHKVATEVTLILSGQVRMIGRVWGEGDILVLEPGVITDFEAISDVVSVVVKLPGVTDDKYLA